MGKYTYSPPHPDRGRNTPTNKSASSPDMSSPDFAPNSYKLMEKLNEEALERHRMNSNAFYKQDSLSRRNATPSVDHPSLRYFNTETPAIGPINLRSSQLTTLSPFINAGRERSGMMRSPSPLHREDVKLVPDDKDDAIPTNRGIIEEYHERAAWNASDKQDERTPVYVYSPKPTPDGFEPSASTNKSTSSASNSDKPKSPRKKFLDRLNFGGGSKATPKKDADVPVISTPTPNEGLAPKAAALLGTSSSKYSMGHARSPSKKDENARKAVDASDASETRSPFASVSRKGQGQSWVGARDANSHPDPAKTPNTDRRVVSQPGPDKNDLVSAIARSKSLHYYDPQVPPTPPTKDTPPDGKTTAPVTALKKSVHQHKHTVHPRFDRIHDETPSKPTVVHMAGNSRTPVRGGGYAHCKATAIHDKEVSVHSMRAEFVDGYHHAVDAANAGLGIQLRQDGLLPGGLLPPTCYSPPAFQVRHVYSPSVYGSEWASGKKNETLKRSNTDGGSPASPSAAPKQSTLRGQLVRSRSFSTVHSESSGQIPMILQTPSRAGDGFDYSGSPTNKPAVSKRVSFEPPRAEYSSEVLHPYSADSRFASYSDPLPTELFTKPTQHSTPVRYTEDDEVTFGAKRRQSDSSEDTIDMLVRITPKDKDVVRQLLNGTSNKFDLFGDMKPDLSPPQQKQWEAFVSRSAVPSPLHFNPRTWEAKQQKSVTSANENEANAAFSASVASTVDDAAGEAEAREMSLRERFIASSEDVTEAGAENDEHDDARSKMTDDGHVQEGYSYSTTHALDHLRGSIDEMHQLIRAVIQGQINTDHQISMLKESVVKVESKLDETVGKMAHMDTKLDTVSQQTNQLNEKLDSFGTKLNTFSENYDTALGDVMQWAEGVNTIQRHDNHTIRVAASVATANAGLGDRVAVLEAHDNLTQRVEEMEVQVALHDRIAAIEQDVRALRARKLSGARRDISGVSVAPAAEITGTGLWKRGDVTASTVDPGRSHGSTAKVTAGRVGKGTVSTAALLWSGGHGSGKK